MIPPEIPSKKWAWLFHQGSDLSALVVRPKGVRKLKIKPLKPESWQPPEPVYDKRMLITPPTSSASYQKVSDMLGYPYCGIASVALASVAAETGFASVLVRGVYRAGNEGSEEQPHAWVRLKTPYGMVSVDLTHGQFGGHDGIISIRTKEEARYGLHPRFELPVEAGDFETMLELATRGGNWERFLPLKEYSAEFIDQLTSALYHAVAWMVFKQAVSFHGKTRLVSLETAIDELIRSGDMVDDNASINSSKERPAIFGSAYQMGSGRQYKMNWYMPREPVALHFSKNKSPGWLRS